MTTPLAGDRRRITRSFYVFLTHGGRLRLQHALWSVLSAALLSTTTHAQTATPVEAVGLVKEWVFRPVTIYGSTAGWSWDTYILFRGGIAINAVPTGSPSTWNADSLAALMPKAAGRWSVVRDSLRIVKASGDVKLFGDWFRMTPARANETFDGRWVNVGAFTEIASGRSTTASAVKELILRPDGRFEGSLSGGASSGAVVTAGSRGGGGRYRTNGYEITLEYEDGRVERKLFGYATENQGTLLVGRVRMLRR